MHELAFPVRRPLLVTAAEFDYSNGLQKTLDFAAQHNVATPMLVFALLACQAGAMVAAANFGTPTPVKARVVTASAQLRRALFPDCVQGL